MSDWLTEKRNDLDIIDTQIMQCLSDRFALIKEIGRFKKDNQISIMQPKRVNGILNKCTQMSKKYDLDSAFLQEIYQLIIKEACKIEEEIWKDGL